MKTSFSIAGVALAMAVAGTVYAEPAKQTRGLYAGADLGLMEVDVGPSADQMVLMGRLGMPINDTFSLEGVFGFGLDGESIGRVEFETETILGIAGVATLPINERTDLYGSLGFYRISIEIEDSRDEDDTDLGFQFGMKHQLQDGVVLHGGYFLGDVEEADYNGLTLGVQFPLNI